MSCARILLRNSTDRQAKAGTVAAQRAPVRDLAQRLGVTQVVEYVEEAVSGAAPLDERDVLRRLLAEAQRGDLVCAFDLSRLTRSDDWTERYLVLGRLRNAGLRPATVEDGEIDLHTLGGRITAHIRGEVAADERKKILARVTAGKRERAAQGGKPQGTTPYGLKYDKATRIWTIDEVAAAVVRELYRRLLTGETCGQIAIDLEVRRVPALRSGRWTSATVWRLVTRAVYRGEWSFEGRVIIVPAIVDAATWQLAQAQLLAAGRRGLRRTQHIYLLDEGVGRCGYCGGPVHVKWGGQGGDTSYYVCPDRRCGLRWRRTAGADDEAWSRIREALYRPDLVEQALQSGREAAGDAVVGEEDAAGFARQLARLGEVESAILARFRRGMISESAMDKELHVIGRERTLLEQSATAASEAAARARANASRLDGVREAMRLIASELEAADPAERRVIVRDLQPDIRLTRETMRITFRLRAPARSMVEPVIALVPGTCSCTENHCDPENALEIAVVA